MKAALDRQYDGFNAPDAARDPIQIVRRYADVRDREIVAFVAAGLAFGRVASIMASIETICAVMAPSPAAFVRAFDRRRDGARLAPFVHRWIKGREMTALFVTLRRMLDEFGSIEACFAAGYDPADDDVGPALDAFGAFAQRGGKSYFFARPSTGAACKRMNLFLRWMIRRDAVDPGGWTMIPPSKLIIPLDTHTIRLGKCLGLTRRASPGWKMAADITRALRQFDADDPVRYDFALCHIGMQNLCTFGRSRRNEACPLHGHCRPKQRQLQVRRVRQVR